MKLTAKAIKTINKNGAFATLRKAGVVSGYVPRSKKVGAN